MKTLHSLEKGKCNVKIKDKGLLDARDNIYKKIYPTSSKSATIYGLPKTYKLLSN